MKIIKYFPAIALLFMASCSDFLDQAPHSQIPQREAYDTPEAINSHLMGAYGATHDALYWEWSVTELRSDNSRMYATGSTASTTKIIEQLDQGTIPTSSTFVQDYWEATFVVVDRCNKILENLDVVPVPLRYQYEAEAKFLRAQMYFNLVRLWGPMFIADRTLTKEEAIALGRSSVDNVYNFIEGDLEDILNMGATPNEIDGDKLPVQHASVDLGRVTSTAARAMLAKVYMTHYRTDETKYATAKTLLEKVLQDVGNPQSGANLVPYADIFDIDNEMNNEIIFAIRYTADGKGLGSPFGNLFAPSSSGMSVINGDGNAYNYPSNSIIAAYPAGDVRKDVNLAESYNDILTGNPKTTDPCRFVKKYVNPVKQRYDGESDWPIIRVGDVILLYAEVESELNGPSATALKYLNMTRQRAGLADIVSADVPSILEFREAVRNERRLELAFENQRWFDLLRWDIATERINDHFADDEFGFYSGYTYTVSPINRNQTMLPIPMTVMNTGNGNFTQNPGY